MILFLYFITPIVVLLTILGLFYDLHIGATAGKKWTKPIAILSGLVGLAVSISQLHNVDGWFNKILVVALATSISSYTGFILAIPIFLLLCVGATIYALIIIIQLIDKTGGFG